MSKIDRIKKTISNSIPEILVLTALTGLVVAAAVTVNRQINAMAADSNPLLEIINDGLADGSLSAVVNETTGVIDIIVNSAN